MRNKRKIVRNLIATFSIGAFALISALIVSVFFKTEDSEKTNFMAYTEYYDNEQSPITSYSAPTKSYVKMSTLYTYDGNNTFTPTSASVSTSSNITIETATDLVAFSRLCYQNNKYLTYKYNLIANIDCSNAPEFYPIGMKKTAFTGTFNGNGFDIKGLRYLSIKSTNVQEAQSYINNGLTYYSMFVLNKGTIQNVGLIDPEMSLFYNSEDGLTNVAPLVGENQTGGTVDHVYVKYMGSIETAGLTASGGFFFSGVMAKNSGTFTNSYSAYTTLVAKSRALEGDYTGLQPVLYTNDGTISNVYFYDEALASLSFDEAGEVVNYDSSTINVEDTNGKTVSLNYGYPYNQTLEVEKLNGNFTNSLDMLNSKVNASDDANWFVKADYSTLGGYFSNTTPILRGLGYDAETKTFTIVDEFDYEYMYELFNMNSYLAGKGVSYKITKDLNLSFIPVDQYKYTGVIGTTITGELASGTNGTAKLVDGSYPSAPTIYNANYLDRKVEQEGVTGYGLFGLFNGKLENVNVVYNDAINVSVTTSNVLALGSAVGFLEGGSISNVHTYMKLTVDSATKAQAFIGGIVGLVTDDGTIYGSASAGTITQNNTSAFTDSANYAQGLYIGGVAGYFADTNGNAEKVLSNVAITALGASGEYVSIGGVIGGGYLGSESGDLENNAAINIGSSSANAQYSNLYAAGVIGRLLGVSSQIKGFNNYGDVKAYLNTNTSTVAGVMNAEIVGATTTSTPVAGLTASKYKIKNVPRFELSSVINGADVTFPGTNKVPTNYTDVINIFSKYGFKTELSGIYNVSYRTINGAKTKLNDKAIDMYYYKEYAPVLNVINATATYDVKVTTSYNLRNIVYTISTANTSSIVYKYSGYARGQYISYNDVRNEGNQTFTINKQMKGTFYASGLFYELSTTSTAATVYNGGNITVTYDTGNSAAFTGKIYLSGICYANRNGISSSDLNKYNPTSASFDNDLPGSIDKAINNGKISITNPNLSGITYNKADVKSANNGQTVGAKYTTNRNNKSWIDGNIYTAGIVNVNESVITNTFNLGDVSAHNYLTSKKEINNAGIANLNIGKYAYILNCANDGDLRSMNVSSDAETDVNVAGIVGRNDKLENGNEYTSTVTNPNSAQIIAFTINYGSLFAYSFSQTIQSTAAIPTCKVAGILAMGLCNIVNTVNYGSIFGSEIASGIFGVVYFANFKNEVSTNNKVLIANSINYSTIYVLERGYNAHLETTEENYETIVKYDQFVNCTKESLADYLHIKIVREQNNKSIASSIIGIINYDDSENAQYIVIRYLVNLNENNESISIQVKIPSGFDPDTTTMYSAYVSKDTRNNGTGAYVRDSYMSTYQKYAPLITTTFTGRFLTSPITGDVEFATTDTITYKGAFSTTFPFRLAVEQGEDSGLVDLVHYPSDAFLNNFFQFVNYKYINDNLMDKIGWSTIAYQTAANEFAQNIKSVLLALSKYTEDNISYTDITNAAFASDTWVEHCSENTLLEVVKTLINEESYAELLSMLQYVFSSDSASNVLITKTLRQNIVDAIIAADSSIDLSGLLASVLTYDNGYSSVLADSILANNNDIKEYIDTYISGLTTAEIEVLLNSYVSYLESNNNAYFSYSNNESQRLALLNALFTNINDNLFYQELINICGVTTPTVSDTLKMASGYSTLSTTEKKTLFNTIITYNGYSNISTYLNSMTSEVNFFSELVKDGYVVTSMETIYDSVAISTTNNTSADVIEARVALWNQIKDTTIFQNYFRTTYGPNTKIYDLATENNNTFQSNTAPSPNGNMSNDNSYLYTQVITPSTYFYGPYAAAGNSPVETVTLVKAPKGYGTTVNLNTILKLKYDNYTKDDGTFGGTEIYGSPFTTEDPSMIPTYFDHNKGTNIKVNNKLANFTIYHGDQVNTFKSKATGLTNCIGNAYLYFYEYGTTSSNNQFARSDQAISGSIQTDQLDARSFKGSRYTLYGYLTDFGGLTFTSTKAKAVDIEGVTFDLAGAATTAIFGYGNGQCKITGEYTADAKNLDAMVVFDTDGVEHLLVANVDGNLCYYIDENGVRHGLYDDNYSQTNGYGYRNNNPSMITLSGLWYKYATRFYMAGVNSNWHSTARTGIYKYKSGSYWWTWKHSTPSICWTTSYIDYNYQQILDLDGYLTSYNADPTYVSNDEKNIINRVFNEYLCTSANSANFRKVAHAALLERIGNDAINGTTYIDTFFNANIYTNTLVNGAYANTYLKVDASTTLKKYLTDRANISSGDYKNTLILAAVNDRALYAKLIKQLIKSNGIAYSAAYADYDDLLNYILNNPSLVSGDNVNLAAMSSLTEAQLATYLSAFDTTNEVAITTPYNMNNVTGTGLTSVRNAATYGSTNYTYGMTFTTLTIPNTYSSSITLIAKSTGTSSTITIGNDETNTVTINGINEYAITLDSTRTIYANNDVVFYAMDEMNGSGTANYTANTTSNSYSITKANLVTYINNANGLNLRESDLTSVSAVFTVYNESNTTRELFVTENHISVGNVAKNGGTALYTISDMTNYFGQSINVYYINKGAYTQGTKLRFSAVQFTVTYKQTNPILVNSTFLKTRYLNLDMPTYSTIQSSYIKYFLNGQTNAYNTFVKGALANLTPVNTSGNDNAPVNYLIDGITTPTVVSGFTNEQKIAFARLIAAGSNESVYNFIANACSTPAQLKTVYDLLVKFNNGYNFLADAIMFGNSSSGVNYTQASKDAITAAYINGDYANIYNLTLSSSSASFYNTVMETLLKKISSDKNYINSNGTFDNDKFDAFASYIGYVVTDSGYGIFALSSSQGIKNGAFVPDNIVLRELGTYYKLNSSNYFELTKTIDETASWRTRGTIASGIDSDLYTGDNDVSYADSVNYGFFIDMKQLKKSIATTVFELDLKTTTGDIFTATQSQVDLDNGIINFYIPNGYIASFEGDTTLTIDNIIYPDTARSTMIEGSTAFSLTTDDQHGLTITAEEDTVQKDYIVRFNEIDISFNMEYSSDLSTNATISGTTVTVEPEGSQVGFNITSPKTTGDKLPEGMDLFAYVYLVDKDGNKVVDSDGNKDGFTKNDLENNMIIDENGAADFLININDELPAGTYTLCLDIFGDTSGGQKTTFTLVKKASTECLITSYVYDGSERTFTYSNNVYRLSTDIQWGRAFDYNELTYTKGFVPEYLDDFVVSHNANVVSVVEVDNLAGDRVTYTITYTITSEDGNSTNTYIHTLKELTPFATNQAFATLYVDGISKGAQSYTSSNVVISNANTTFTRTESPAYLVRYILGNFYTDGSYTSEIAGYYSPANINVIDKTTVAGLADSPALATPLGTGFSVSVSTSEDTGYYIYTYVYSNKGTWKNGEEYTRELMLPALKLYKSYSLVSLLQTVQILQADPLLGALATVVEPEYSIVPLEQSKVTNNSVSYYYLTQAIGNNKVSVDASTSRINYMNIAPNDYSTSTDFYVVGTTSGAELSSYSPTLGIDEYAEIYQYTTRTKLTTYGTAAQGNDYDVLNNHNDIYLYVPYNYVSGDKTMTEIFLVELTSTGWGRVYSTEWKGTDVSKNVATVGADHSFTSDGVKYTVSPYSGTTNEGNTSLKWDYTGTPAENTFWYNSYVIFSEKDVKNKYSTENAKFYHFAIIDQSNNINFKFKVDIADGVLSDGQTDLGDLYLSMVYTYDKKVQQGSQMVSVETTESIGVNLSYDPASGEYVIPADTPLQLLPAGYYSFFIDFGQENSKKRLAVSIQLSADCGKKNQNTEVDDPSSEYYGQYLPPSSIVTQTVMMIITVSPDTSSGSSSSAAWAAGYTEKVHSSAVLLSGNSTIPYYDED